jgi:two-component system OmpR family response regulator/two-component system alkaline phosphatase synthesis response regulator PhoP
MVLDVMMPKLNGWEVCKYVRSKEAFNDVGIVMLTAIGPRLNELTSPLYGADEHLDKPFDLDELEALIEKVLLDRHGITVG